MPNSAEQFFRRLNIAAEAELGRAEARTVTEEIRVHLDAAIQARLELGETPEEAEQGAIAGFGDIETFVRGMRRVAPSSMSDRRFVLRVGGGWLALFISGYVAWHFGEGSPVWMNYVLLPMGFVLAAVILFESVRAKKVQLGAVALLYVAFTLLAAMGQARVALPETQDGPAIDRSDQRDWLGVYRDQATRTDAALAEYERFRAEFKAGGLIAPFPQPPHHAGPAGTEAAVRYVALSDPHAVSVQWDKVDRTWQPEAQKLVRHAELEGQLLARRMSHPWILDTGGWLLVSASICVIPAAATLLLNLFGAFLGLAGRQIGRWRRSVS